MNRLTCTLLSGASIVALMFGGDLAKGIGAKAAPANADGTTAGFATTGNVDYLIITGDYESGQDVVVSTGDTVTGPPFASAIPLDDLPFGGPALGQFGVVVTAATITVDGSIINNGAISFAVDTGLTANDVVVGIGNNGGVINGQIANNGIMNIAATDIGVNADFANAVGVAVTDVAGSTTFLNAAAGELRVRAFASDTGPVANNASANAIGVFQDAEAADTAAASVTNDGLVVVQATANHAPTAAATGSEFGTVAYAAAAGVVQLVAAPTGDFATAFFDNNGILNVTANANAIAAAFGASASANAIGFSQSATASLEAFATFINDNVVNVVARAAAAAGDQYANAFAYANGGFQNVAGSDATASVVNNGVINVLADAHAVNGLTDTGAGAFASALAEGFGQTVFATGETGLAFVDNNNALNVDAVAVATGVEGAGAGAYATGIYQDVGSYGSGPVNGTASVQNAGVIDVTANAQANLGAITATPVAVTVEASASAIGIRQDISALSDATAKVVNNGTLDVAAIAVANAGSQYASASATAVGIRQDVANFTAATDDDTNVARAQVTNDGLIHVAATASAFNDLVAIGTITPTGTTFVIGNPFAWASAQATGIDQQVTGLDGVSIVAVFNNNVVGTGTAAVAGVLSVEANAFASGVSAEAGAYATGVNQYAFDHHAASALASVQNDGDINVAANATAIVDQATTVTSAFASATARGIVQDAGAATADAQAVVNNGGLLNVTAHAVASIIANTYTFETTPGGEGPYVVTANLPVGDARANALAEGIVQDAFGGASGTASVANSGIINVNATAEASVPSFRALGDADGTANYAGARATATGISQFADAGYIGNYATPVAEAAMSRLRWSSIPRMRN